MKPEIKTRIAIIDILTEVLEKKHSLTHVLPRFLAKFQDQRDKALIQFCSYGILREYLKLNLIIKKQVPKKITEQKTYYLLILGIYQLINSRMPSFAIVHSTVETAKKLKLFSTTGLINAVLREVQRQTHINNRNLENDPEAKWLHPTWLLDKFQQHWPAQWQDICAANNQHPPLWLRVNTQKITPEAYIELLQTKNIPIKSANHESICLASAIDIQDLPGFDKGLVSVQDAAAQMAAHLLDLKPHQLVLDACAAPGGKTCHILEKEKVNLLAIDKDKARIEKIHENLKRLELHANVLQADALNPKEWWQGELFDRILLDAPCSATGVIRRHPDIKILRQPADIPALAQQQIHLLNALWPLLKSQGKMVYATCSILPVENEKVIERFCAEHADSHLKMTQRILPGENDCDGFFYAVMVKS